MKVYFLCVMAILSGVHSFAGDESFKAQGESSFLKYDRIHLYSLKGNLKEVAKLAGEWIPKNALRKGMIPFMSRVVFKAVDRSEFIRRNPILKLAFPTFLSLKYYSGMVDALPADQLAFIDALAEGMGFSQQLTRRAFVNPDIFHLIIADVKSNRILPFQSPDSQPLAMANLATQNFGCSSFVTLPEKTKDGEVIFGRVQDYVGLDSWDPYPAIYYISTPGSYDYVSIGSIGMILGAVTAMNEKGLAMSVHSSMMTENNPRGHSILTTSQRMISHAATIEEAATICNENVPASSWMMTLADTKNGKSRAARIEVNSKFGYCSIEFAKEGFIASTNHLHNAKNKKDEMSFGPGIDFESRERYQRIYQMLAEKDKIDLPYAFEILADRYDPRVKRYMTYPPSGISTVDQLMAVVMLPKSKQIWMSNGLAPSASQGEYLRFDFDALKDLKKIKAGEGVARIDIRKMLNHTPNELPAVYQDFKQAYRAAANDYDFLEVEKALSSAVKKEPDEPIFRMMRGVIRMRNHKLSLAKKDLQKALAQSSSSKNLDFHRQSVTKLYLARLYDSQNQLKKSRAIYQEISLDSNVHAKVRKAATKNMLEPFTVADLDYVDPDLKYADFVEY